MDVTSDKNVKKDYTFHLKAFNGPLELLMHLIEKNKIDIYDIPIAELTRQYLDYLGAMREMDMEVTSSFLVMAATLLQIKSRMMLPKKPRAEEGEEEDPRQELVERLLEYRRFKKVSEVLGSMADLQEHFVSRAPLDLPVHHLPPGNLDLSLLVTAFREVISIKEEAELPAAIVRPEPYHIEDKMEDITRVLQAHSGRIRFEDAFREGTRSELVVTFLALLELMKQRAVTVQQDHLFGQITIIWRRSKNDERE